MVNLCTSMKGRGGVDRTAGLGQVSNYSVFSCLIQYVTIHPVKILLARQIFVHCQSKCIVSA